VTQASFILYFLVIVLLSLLGSFISSAVLSVIAVDCLAYYFAPPLFDFRVGNTFDAIGLDRS
jgi:hypothetical protein